MERDAVGDRRGRHHEHVRAKPGDGAGRDAPHIGAAPVVVLPAEAEQRDPRHRAQLVHHRERVRDDGERSLLVQVRHEVERRGGVVEHDRLARLDEVEGRQRERPLLRDLAARSVDIARLDEPRRQRRRHAAVFAQQAARGEFVEIAVNRHRADVEALGQIGDPDGSGGHHGLCDRVAPVGLSRLTRHGRIGRDRTFGSHHRPPPLCCSSASIDAGRPRGRPA